MVEDKALDKQLSLVRRFGGFPVVKDAPSWMLPVDKMIIVYLDEANKRMYQVHCYNSKTGKVVGTF